jgi:hypothetical protein
LKGIKNKRVTPEDVTHRFSVSLSIQTGEFGTAGKTYFHTSEPNMGDYQDQKERKAAMLARVAPKQHRPASDLLRPNNTRRNCEGDVSCLLGSRPKPEYQMTTNLVSGGGL